MKISNRIEFTHSQLMATSSNDITHSLKKLFSYSSIPFNCDWISHWNLWCYPSSSIVSWMPVRRCKIWYKLNLLVLRSKTNIHFHKPSYNKTRGKRMVNVIKECQKLHFEPALKQWIGHITSSKEEKYNLILALYFPPRFSLS